jgi:hypothetical protein
MERNNKAGRPTMNIDTKKVPISIYLKGIEIDALGGKNKLKADMKSHVTAILARLKLSAEK